jgi:hypothetical protein
MRLTFLGDAIFDCSASLRFLGDISTESLSLVGINSLDGLFDRARRCSKSRPGTAHALEDENGIFGEHAKKREAVSLAYQKRRTDVGEPRCALGQQWVAQGCRRIAGKNTSIRIRASENCRHADRITHGLDQDCKRAGKSNDKIAARPDRLSIDIPA